MPKRKSTPPPSIDLSGVGIPDDLVDALDRAISETPPVVPPDEAMLKRLADAETETAIVGDKAVTRLHGNSGWIRKRGLAKEVDDLCMSLTAELESKRRELESAKKKAPAELPASRVGDFTLAKAARQTLISAVCWSVPTALFLAVGFVVIAYLELFGVQLGSLMSSKVGWAQSPLSALGFCMSFSLLVFLATNDKKLIEARGDKESAEAKHARRWCWTAWIVLGLFGGMLGLLHFRPEHGWSLAIGFLVLTAAGPIFLAKCGLIIEGLISGHLKRALGWTLVDNPAIAELNRQIKDNNDKCRTVGRVTTRVRVCEEQIDDHEQATRDDWEAMHDGFLARIRGLKEKHDLEAEIDLATRRRKQSEERRRLLDP